MREWHDPERWTQWVSGKPAAPDGQGKLCEPMRNALRKTQRIEEKIRKR